MNGAGAEKGVEKLMRDCKEVLEHLRESDTEVAREAAHFAGELACKEAVPFLVEFLKSANLGLQEAADRALRKIGGRTSVQAAIPLLRSEDVPVRNLAMDILREIGGRDFSSLVDLLHDSDPDVRIFAADILGATKSQVAVAPLGKALLKDPEVNVRYQAAVSLGDLQRVEAAEWLNKALNDEEWVQFAVIEALSKIGDASSVGALVKALDNSSDLVCSMIVEALGEMGDVKAVSMLLKRLDSSHMALRNKIVKAVVKILGGRSLTLLSEDQWEGFGGYLLDALEDEDKDIQDAAISGLGFMGRGEASGPILDLAAQMDPDREYARLEQTVRSLADIGLTEALEKGLREGDSAVARTAVSAFAIIGGENVEKLLMEVFWSKDRDLQRDLVRALGGFAGPSAKDFFLEVLERHEDGTVLKEALSFLGRKLRLSEVGEKLFEFLDNPYDDVKEAALDACVAVSGPEMTARFKELYHSLDPVHRLMAVYALGRLGFGENMDELKSALEDEVPDIRKVAVESFSFCREPKEGLPFIVTRLSDENREVRLAVVELMGKCEHEEVVPYLKQALGDRDDWVRVRAVEALGGRGVSDSVSTLVSMVDDPSKLVALKAVEALGNLGGGEAFNALLTVVNREDAELQSAAEEAIAKIQSEHGEGD
ncbi:MAG: HEAT repeat domain-containing protein [Thermodesulfobacteriota bacterium]|nr:HEAT repeat domain-containing protein [Thermodesulfobacteriota bacterium]